MSSSKSPERALMAAVLSDAVKLVLEKRERVSDPVALEEREEAVEWLADDDREYLFSFHSICEHLDLDPAALRAGIANQLRARDFSWRGMRRRAV